MKRPPGKYIAGHRVLEIGARGNRHFNKRRPDGPVCADCGAPWKPICPTRGCPGGRIPAGMMRAEKQDHGTRRYGQRQDVKPQPLKPVTPAKREREPSAMDAKLKALEAKYGGRHERRRAA